MTVGASRLQFVLAMAATTTMLVCSTATQAGYVSAATLAEQDGMDALAYLSSLLTAEYKASSNTASYTASPRPHDDDPQTPAQPTSPLLKMLPAACDFGASGAGSSSSSTAGGSPSFPPADDLPRPRVPSLEPTSLLPPPMGVAHSFFLTSTIFRPPRAA